MHFQFFWEVDERFEGLEFLLEIENVMDDFVFFVLELMNLGNILIFLELIKSFFFLI